MSLKQLKSPESCMPNPEPKGASSADLTRVQQRQWRNSLRYNLHDKFSLNEQYERSYQRYIKAFIRFYYGKKILYVTNTREANAIVSRSKLLKSVEIQKNVSKTNLKSKGNLVILVRDFPNQSQKPDDGYLPKDNHLLFKKILKHCQKAKVTIENENNIKLPQALLASKHLNIRIAGSLELTVLGDIVRNLLNLEKIRIETISKSWFQSKPKNGIFTSLQKLSRLKRVKLSTYSNMIFIANLREDLEKFYSRPIKFSLSIKIKNMPQSGEEEFPNLARVLNAAQYLSLSTFKYAEDDHKEDSRSMVTKEEKKMLKLGMKNIVKIFSISEAFDLAEILSNCGSLESLYIRDISSLTRWRKEESDSIRGFQNLKVAVLEFYKICFRRNAHISDSDDESNDASNDDKDDETYNYRDDESNDDIDDDIDDEINSDKDDENLTPNPLFIFCSEIKKKCCSFQHLSLQLSLSFYDDLLSISSKNLSSARESLKPYVQELSKFDKLKRLVLVTTPHKLHLLPLTDILSNKGLESLELKFRDLKPIDPEWDSCFATENVASEIKKLTITIPKERKIPLCGTVFLNYIRRLDNLQVVELIDKNLQVITFDFLYGFVTSLLDKKNMKKINILTKLVNNISSNGLEMLFSNSLEIRLKNIFDEVVQDWESRINILKKLQLEEIFVGRLHGFRFDYLVYHKEMEITDKVLWTGKEICKVLDSKRVLRRNNPRVFDLYNASK